jgi:hypothetical protein
VTKERKDIHLKTTEIIRVHCSTFWSIKVLCRTVSKYISLTPTTMLFCGNCTQIINTYMGKGQWHFRELFHYCINFWTVQPSTYQRTC